MPPLSRGEGYGNADRSAENGINSETSLPSGRLVFYKKSLITNLAKYRIKTPEVWIKQAAAIIDPKEMVEIRHRLINRRQKIRTQLDTNMKIMQDAKDEISRLVADHQEYAKEILQIVDSVEQEI